MNRRDLHEAIAACVREPSEAAQYAIGVAHASPGLDEGGRERPVVRKSPLGRATVLAHPELEFRDEWWRRWKRHGRDQTSSTKMLDEVQHIHHDDLALVATMPLPRGTRARHRPLPSTPTATKVPPKFLKQVIVYHRGLHASAAQPHTEVKDRTNRSFSCQRAVTRREARIDELVQELSERLLAHELTSRWRVEGAEATCCIMRSRFGHLDAATNGGRVRIIPSSA
jgi:hypothetical protein